jgi:hypothetical protein
MFVGPPRTSKIHAHVRFCFGSCFKNTRFRDHCTYVPTTAWKHGMEAGTSVVTIVDAISTIFAGRITTVPILWKPTLLPFLFRRWHGVENRRTRLSKSCSWLIDVEESFDLRACSSFQPTFASSWRISIRYRGCCCELLYLKLLQNSKTWWTFAPSCWGDRF